MTKLRQFYEWFSGKGCSVVAVVAGKQKSCLCFTIIWWLFSRGGSRIFLREQHFRKLHFFHILHSSSCFLLLRGGTTCCKCCTVEPPLLFAYAILAYIVTWEDGNIPLNKGVYRPAPTNLDGKCEFLQMGHFPPNNSNHNRYALSKESGAEC